MITPHPEAINLGQRSDNEIASERMKRQLEAQRKSDDLFGRAVATPSELTHQVVAGIVQRVANIDNMLAMLRRNGVSEYEDTPNGGIRVKFFTSKPTLEAAQEVIKEELERIVAAPPEPKKEEPPPGAVETERFDLDDVLHGAK